MSGHVRTELKDGVLEIVIDRPDKKNALSQAMYAAMNDAMDRVDADDAVRVALFSSSGPDFTAGNDIGDFADAAKSGRPPLAGVFIRKLAQARKPLVAAVPGVAVGLGTTMLLHCDMVFVTPDAKLTVPFVNLALVPEAASSILLPARIGHARAFEMFALGRPVSGEEAVTVGLANRALPYEELNEAARDACRRLAAQPPGAVMATKALLRDPEELLERIERESVVFGERLVSAEAQEAFAAFMERRKPDFSKLG